MGPPKTSPLTGFLLIPLSNVCDMPWATHAAATESPGPLPCTLLVEANVHQPCPRPPTPPGCPSYGRVQATAGVWTASLWYRINLVPLRTFDEGDGGRVLLNNSASPGAGDGGGSDTTHPPTHPRGPPPTHPTLKKALAGGCIAFDQHNRNRQDWHTVR